MTNRVERPGSTPPKILTQNVLYSLLTMKSRSQHHRHSPRLRGHARRAAVLVWFVYIIPLMMLLLFALTDYGTTIRTGIELKNAVDASALSAVKSWASLGPSAAWRDADATFHGNAVLGTSRALTTAAADRGSPDFLGKGAEVTFGILQDVGRQHVFHPIGQREMTSDRLKSPAMKPFAATVTDHHGTLCVRVRRSLLVTGIGGRWQQATFGNYSVTAESFARLCPDRGVPQLVHVDVVSPVAGSWEALR